MAAACYMAFGRVVWWVTPSSQRGFRQLWVPARWITPLFLTFDLGAFCIQFLASTATGLAALRYQQGEDRQRLAEKGIAVIKLGLFLQLTGFALFSVVSIRFIVVSKRWRDQWPFQARGNWRRLAWAINVACILITVFASCSLSGVHKLTKTSSVHSIESLSSPVPNTLITTFDPTSGPSGP